MRDFDDLRFNSGYLKEEHRLFRDQVRRFVTRELAPNVTEWERGSGIPNLTFEKAASAGLLGLGYPEELGGVSKGVDVFHRNILNEELARVAGGIWTSLSVHNIALPPLISGAKEEIKKLVVPPVLAGKSFISLGVTEPSGGSDVAAIRTRGERKGSTIEVNGSKTFITGGLRANWVLTAISTQDEGRSGISLLVIPTDLPGVERHSVGQKQGWESSETATIFFDQVRVPDKYLVGEWNNGFPLVMDNFNYERISLSCAALSGARVCVEEAAKWANDRRTFGKKLVDHQVIRHKFAEMRRKLNASYAYLDQCSALYQEGRVDPGDIALLKVQATLTAEFCAREAMQILGGAGYLRGSPTERFYREVRVLAIGGGSEEIMREFGGRPFSW